MYNHWQCDQFTAGIHKSSMLLLLVVVVRLISCLCIPWIDVKRSTKAQAAWNEGILKVNHTLVYTHLHNNSHPVGEYRGILELLIKTKNKNFVPKHQRKLHPILNTDEHPWPSDGARNMPKIPEEIFIRSFCCLDSLQTWPLLNSLNVHTECAWISTPGQ